STFIFHNSATPEIYTLSLHDALPILWKPKVNKVCAAWRRGRLRRQKKPPAFPDFSSFFKFCAVYKKSLKNYEKVFYALAYMARGDRKSTRLNSSHVKISYAVFCLKKK